MFSFALALLSGIAVLSPLLTLAWLWQLKEWRIDRLKEHLRHSGWRSQLLGSMRPAIILLYAFALALFLEIGIWHAHMPFIAGSALGILCGISAIQVLSGHQRIPRWTQKAIAIMASGILINVILIALLLSNDSLKPGLPFIAIIQPLVLLISWIIFYPLDRFLKKRILARARVLRERYHHLTVIGITGSVGKTTTKELLAHILAKRSPLVTPVHVNTEMGIARWLTNKLSTGPVAPDSIVITEMGAYRKGEIALLCSITKPTIGIITSIGEQHLALFGSKQNIIDAKSELFQSLSPDGHAFVNADNDAAGQLLAKCRCPVTTVGTESGVDALATDIQETPGGIRFTVDNVVFDVPLYGTHQTVNILLSIVCAKALGMHLKEISQQLRTFKGISRTFEVRLERGIRILDDTHNASPQSFIAGIEWARHQPEQKKILITSGIIELGQAEQPIHEKLALTAAGIFHHVYLTDDRLLPIFAKAFAGRASFIDDSPSPQPSGSLLVCIGRISPRTLNHLLPTSST